MTSIANLAQPLQMRIGLRLRGIHLRQQGPGLLFGFVTE